MDAMVPLHVEPGPAPRTVSLAGELDAASAHGVADQVALHLPGPGDARLDLSQLDALDAGGLRAIQKIADALGPGHRLVLLFPNKQVRSTLEASGILDSDRLTIAPGGPLDGIRVINLDVGLDEPYLSSPSELPFIWLG
jgi:anti-anti-sigma factor